MLIKQLEGEIRNLKTEIRNVMKKHIKCYRNRCSYKIQILIY